MTKEQVLEKLKFDVELRGLSKNTQDEYLTKAKVFQDYFDKPATELGVCWIENQKSNLLDVGYFHVVFTIPDTLNLMAYQNQKVVYTLLFKAVAETLAELASDKKYLGAKIGSSAVLHTWGQNLMHHPHIHCIVPGGGLSSVGKWVNSNCFLQVAGLQGRQ